MWMDLYLDPSRRRQTSAMLFEQIRDAITDGRLAPGDRLPTTRWLAADLGISRSAVTDVYARLVAEGIIEGRVGDGTFVADHPVARSATGSTGDSIVARRRPPSRPPRWPTLVPADIEIDLRTGRPDPTVFPLRAWRRAVSEAVELPPPGYGDAAGLPSLRSAIAAWVGRTRGIVVGADQVLVTAGAQQAFDLCARVLVAPGDLVAFEDPGYEPARRAFLHHGALAQYVPVDHDGIVVDAIDPAAKLVYTTPSHQSPTGVTMSASRRRALLEHADAHGAAIIEDDYDTEYRFVDRPLEPLHRLDPGGRVIYLGTFSKTLSPSLRLGFLVVPPGVLADLTAARSVSDGQPPHLTQAALANLILSGDFDRHLRRTRAVYRGRHALVQTRIGDLHASGLVAAPWRSNAGLHTMIELLPGTDATAVSDELALSGIVVETTQGYSATETAPALVIGYGLVDTEQLGVALDALEEALRRGVGRPGR